MPGFAHLTAHVALAGLICACAVVATHVHADMSGVVERIKPSIVAVGTLKSTDNPPFALRGTGFVVEDGNLVVTNAHVIAAGAELAGGATLAIHARVGGSAQTRRARIVVVAPEYDLAVLRFEEAALPALAIRDSATVREGHMVGFTGFPIGSALGFSPVTHRGMVSAITPIALPGANARQLSEKLVRRLRSGTFEIFQLDATAYPGNSGSPVFDAASGDVIGILNMVLVKGTKEAALSAPSGIAYAIPSNFVLELLRASR